MNENTIQQVPKELEERLEQIREIIRSDTLEYARVPSIRDLSKELGIAMEEVAECILYLPTDEFCDFVTFLKPYEWELVSQISEMKSRETSDVEIEDDEDGEDYSLIENFHFMT